MTGAKREILGLSFLLVLIFLLIQILGLAVGGTIWGRETLGEFEYATTELKNKEIVFLIDKLVTGRHELQVYCYGPNVNNDLEKIQHPVQLELAVQIQQGKKLKEKKISISLEKGYSTGAYRIFNVPTDFLWSRKANLVITIKDIRFNDEFAQYFQKVLFKIRHLQLIGK
jgi:hypothetical protein